MAVLNASKVLALDERLDALLHRRWLGLEVRQLLHHLRGPARKTAKQVRIEEWNITAGIRTRFWRKQEAKKERGNGT